MNDNAADAREEFVEECIAAIKDAAPDFRYRPADLWGFVAACWPTTDSPEDVAGDFVDAVNTQRTAN